MIHIWPHIVDLIQQKKKAVLLCVIESKGSSPGRQGFKMLVTKEQLVGSIGGGVMEHKLVEFSRVLLDQDHFEPFIKEQVHRSNQKNDKSGMICSGEQVIAFYSVPLDEPALFEEIANSSDRVVLDNERIKLNPSTQENQFSVERSESTWSYSEKLNFKNQVHIIGAGHIGLALSKVMHDLQFDVNIYDDRSELNTLLENNFAKQNIIDYESIDTSIPEGENVYLVLVSFGYRIDKICMQRLLKKKVRYFGVMGSATKMEKLLNELRDEGFTDEELSRVHTPIGVQIKSETPGEIAISIAAQIIGVKNQST